MRSVLEVTGTTVITPRPRRVAAALAASLLTTTAGRIFLASDPRAGSRLTWTISPRRTSVGQAVAGGGGPCPRIIAGTPGGPGLLVCVFKLAGPQEPDGPVHDRGPGPDALSLGVGIEEIHVIVRQAHTDLHTLNTTSGTTRVVANSSETLDDGGRGHGATGAHGDQGGGGVPALQLMQGGGDQPGSGAADRVAEGDRAAVDVDLVRVGPVHAEPGQDHRGERLVDLEQGDVA